VRAGQVAGVGQLHVKQIGASRPRSKRSRSDDSGTQEPRRVQRRERGDVSGALIDRDELVQRGTDTVEVAHAAN